MPRFTRALTAVALTAVLLPACSEMAPPRSAEAKSDASPADAPQPPPPPPPPKEEAFGGAYADAAVTGAHAPGGAGNFVAAPPSPPPPPARGAPPAQPPPPTAKPPAPTAEATSPVAVRAPLLIYTAQITMAVFEVNAGLTRVEGIGRELGGFLAKRDDRSITIRVPADKFDEALKRIESAGDMVHRNVTAEDVTEEFRDLEVRLKSARAVQQRYTELLAKAVKVEESIAIERELDRVSGEIERIEGRIKFLRDRAAFSTITVSFEPKPQEQVAKKEIRLPVEWLYDLGLRRLLSL